jgi:hypothetical protein
MSRTEKTVITIETFQRTVVRTRRTTGAGPNDEHAEEAAVSPKAADQLQRSTIQELARTEADEER